MRVRPRLVPLLVVASLVLVVPPAASGQATGPTFVEPLEYGVDERHDPFDYTQATDLMTDSDVNVGVAYPATQPPGTARFRATGNAGGNWYVSPVWMTFPHHVDPSAQDLPDADGGALHDQRDGLALPVDADTYTHVSLRFHVAGRPGQVYLSWFSCQEWLPACQGLMRLHVERGWNTVVLPVANNVPSSGLSQPWRGDVHGLRLQGVVEDPVTVTLDWFRLFDGGSEYDVEVTRDANRYLYSDRSVFGGDNAADADEVWGRLRPSAPYTSPFRVNVGSLPPGRWYLFDEAGTRVGQAEVLARPRPEILDPDMAGGVDYATEVLGNPWDFDDREDAVAVGNARGVRWSGGELSAINTTNDPYVQLPLGPDGLDPVHYHRVTVDQHYDADFNLDDAAGAFNPAPGGSHGRLLWRTDRHPAAPRDCAHVSDGREFVFYKTWDTYTYDMRHVPLAQGTSSSAEPNIGVTYCTATGPDPHWTDRGPITFLRFDPHEAPTQYRWYLADLRIAADDAADPTFDITWVDHQPVPGTEVTVRLAPDRSGEGGEVLATVPQAEGVNRVTFDATDRLPGTHWVHLTSRAPDGRVSRDRATGPLQVAPRIAGRDRVATAIEVSRQSFDAARTAVVASSATFPDALVSVQLADAVGGPVLLTGPRQLDARVGAELQRLGVDEVVLAGGDVAVSPDVQQALARTGVDVTRIGGATRYDTAVAIARETLRRRGTTTAPRVLVATGEDFPDALAAGPLVGHGDTPLVLARPVPPAAPAPDPDGDGDTPPPTPPPTVPADNDAARQFLEDVGAVRATVLGGRAALSDDVVEYVAGGRSLDRIAGRDRFETGRRLTEAAVAAGGSASDVLVATGRDFPDALSAGPAALARGGVLVLTEKDGVPAPTRAWLSEVGTWSSWRVVGGPLAVSHATVRHLRRAADL